MRDDGANLPALVSRLAQQARRAIQELGPSSILFEMEETVRLVEEALRRPAGAEAEERGNEPRVGEGIAPEEEGERLAAMRQAMQREEFAGRLARRLESTLGQIITNAVTELEYAVPLIQSDPEAVREGLRHVQSELDQGRQIFRWIVADLRQPHLLADLGLGPSLSRYAERFAEHSGLPVETEPLRSFSARLPASVELGLFRIVQEALRNAWQHAGASRIQLRVEEREGAITFSVEDDGRGFDDSLPAAGLGLTEMRERARAIGGRLHVLTRPGAGTVVMVSVPAALKTELAARGEN